MTAGRDPGQCSKNWLVLTPFSKSGSFIENSVTSFLNYFLTLQFRLPVLLKIKSVGVAVQRTLGSALKQFHRQIGTYSYVNVWLPLRFLGDMTPLQMHFSSLPVFSSSVPGCLYSGKPAAATVLLAILRESGCVFFIHS